MVFDWMAFYPEWADKPRDGLFSVETWKNVDELIMEESMKSSSITDGRCPLCNDRVSRDLTARGFVRHLTNPDCRYEGGQKD